MYESPLMLIIWPVMSPLVASITTTSAASSAVPNLAASGKVNVVLDEKGLAERIVNLIEERSPEAVSKLGLRVCLTINDGGGFGGSLSESGPASLPILPIIRPGGTHAVGAQFAASRARFSRKTRLG